MCGCVVGALWVCCGCDVGALWVRCGFVVGALWVRCGCVVGVLGVCFVVMYTALGKSQNLTVNITLEAGI